MHYQVAEDHGFTAIADVQIQDENGSMALPQLIRYSASLGGTVFMARILSCFLCGVAAGGIVNGIL